MYVHVQTSMHTLTHTHTQLMGHTHTRSHRPRSVRCQIDTCHIFAMYLLIFHNKSKASTNLYLIALLKKKKSIFYTFLPHVNFPFTNNVKSKFYAISALLTYISGVYILM